MLGSSNVKSSEEEVRISMPPRVLDWNRVFVKAAGNGEAGLVDYLLKNNKVTTYALIEGFINAANNGQSEVAQSLLNNFETLGKAIIAAASNKHKNIVDWLLKIAEVTSKDLRGAFIKAVINNDLDMAGKLLNNDSVTSGNYDLITFLISSAENNHREVVKYLFTYVNDKGGNISDELINSFIKAVKKGRTSLAIYSILAQVSNFPEKVTPPQAPNCDMAFVKAASNGQSEVFYSLLKNNKVTTYALRWGFVYAAKNGHMNLVNDLFKYNEIKTNFETLGKAIIAAKSNNHEDMVDWLLKNAKVTSKDLRGAFIEAVKKNELNIAEKLLNNDSVTSGNYDLKNFLDNEVKSDSLEVVKFLFFYIICKSKINGKINSKTISNELIDTFIKALKTTIPPKRIPQTSQKPQMPRYPVYSRGKSTHNVTLQN